jgi:hypothetical protein
MMIIAAPSVNAKKMQAGMFCNMFKKNSLSHEA